jgi:ribosome modulation factor
MNEYDEGYKAYEDGKSDVDNPYDSSSQKNAWNLWLLGYRDAQDDDLGQDM